MPNGQADFPNERATAARWPQAGGRDGRGSGIFRQKGEGRQKQASVFQSAALDFQSAALKIQSQALKIQSQALKIQSQALKDQSLRLTGPPCLRGGAMLPKGGGFTAGR